MYMYIQGEYRIQFQFAYSTTIENKEGIFFKNVYKYNAIRCFHINPKVRFIKKCTIVQENKSVTKIVF